MGLLIPKRLDCVTSRAGQQLQSKQTMVCWIIDRPEVLKIVNPLRLKFSRLLTKSGLNRTGPRLEITDMEKYFFIPFLFAALDNLDHILLCYHESNNKRLARSREIMTHPCPCTQKGRVGMFNQQKVTLRPGTLHHRPMFQHRECCHGLKRTNKAIARQLLMRQPPALSST